MKSLKHYLNVYVLGICVFYCITPLYYCDYVRVISLNRIRGLKKGGEGGGVLDRGIMFNTPLSKF